MNWDRRVSAQDVLVVITHLNGQAVAPGEAEPPRTAPRWPRENRAEIDEELWGLLAADRVHRRPWPLSGEMV